MSLERVCSANNVSVLEDLIIDLNKRVNLVVALRDAMLRNPDNEYIVACFDDSVFDLQTSCNDLGVWQNCLRNGSDMNSPGDISSLV